MNKEEKVYVVTLDQGKFAQQALYQTKSIIQNVDNPEIFVYITNDRGTEAISESDRDWLEEQATVTEGPVPIDDYPISAKTRAAVRASKKYPEKTLVVLDSDMLILEDIEVPEEDIAMTPVNMGEQKWGKDSMKSEWKRWREKFGIEEPSKEIKSTVDGKELPFPMYNVGVMVIKPQEFSQRWEEVRDDMYSELGAFHFLHQIAASLLAADYEVKVLEEKYNYPLNIRYYCPSNVKILHYHDFKHLKSPIHPKIQEKISKLEIEEDLSTIDIFRSFYKPTDRRFLPNLISAGINKVQRLLKST